MHRLRCCQPATALDLVMKVHRHPSTSQVTDGAMGAAHCQRLGAGRRRPPAGLARALALVRGDNWVSVDLIKEIFVPAVAHRMIMQDPATPAAGVLQEILDTVPVDGRRPAQRDVPESPQPVPVSAMGG